MLPVAMAMFLSGPQDITMFEVEPRERDGKRRERGNKNKKQKKQRKNKGYSINALFFRELSVGGTS